MQCRDTGLRYFSCDDSGYAFQNGINKMNDRFRKQYHVLLAENQQFICDMKMKAEELEIFFEKVKNREMSLAITNLEQALMWATKAIVLHDQEIQKEQNAVA